MCIGETARSAPSDMSVHRPLSGLVTGTIGTGVAWESAMVRTPLRKNSARAWAGVSDSGKCSPRKGASRAERASARTVPCPSDWNW